MTGSLSEYDRRQFTLMREFLAAFAGGGLGLPGLIDRLRGLIDALIAPPLDWRRRALLAWGALEIQYAVAVDAAEREGRSKVHLEPGAEAAVATAVAELRALVDEALRD